MQDRDCSDTVGWCSAPDSKADGSKRTPDPCSQELSFYWKEQTGKN